MNKLIIFLSFLCIAVLISPVTAVDIGASFTLSNIDFSPDRSKTDTTLSGTDYLYGLSVFGSADVSTDMSIEAGVLYDPILRYSAYSLLSYRSEFLRLKAGPFFGLLNDWGTILKPGISTEIIIDIPGKVFARLNADSSIGGRLVRTGEYLQEKSVLGVGFYVPHAVCEVAVTTKAYTEKTSAGEMVDKLQEYAFITDIFQKNTPYRVELSFAYQNRTLSFIETTTTDHILNSLVLGTRIDMLASDKLDVFIDLESNIYSFGEAGNSFIELADSGIGVYLFSLTSGFKFRL